MKVTSNFCCVARAADGERNQYVLTSGSSARRAVLSSSSFVRSASASTPRSASSPRNPSASVRSPYDGWSILFHGLLDAHAALPASASAALFSNDE
eukprot:6210032-Pleurochrysis_carterae.AAC.3